jgi:DNA repair exonuclease SbcCD ATPase subunit
MAFDVSSIFADETRKDMQVHPGQAVDVPRSPETLGSEIRYLSAQAKSMTVWFGVEIGKRLAEAKEMVGHGGWLDFLKTETEFSSSSASRFMQIAREYGGKTSNFPTLGNLSVSNALRLLAVPEDEREEFAQAVDAEHISSRELEQAIRERDEARKALEEAQSAAVQLTERTEKQAEQIRELENRPVEVAVQVADPAEIEKVVAEALSAAEKKHKAALDSAERLRKAAEKKQAELQAIADSAAKIESTNRAEAEKLNTRIADLQKELELVRAEQTAAAKASSIQSDADVAVFQSFFQATLENFNKACGLLTKVKLRDADKADKLLRFSRDAVAKMAAALEKEG